MSKIWLLDVDGTAAADNKDYYVFLQTKPKNWKAFFHGSIHAPCNEQVRSITNMLYEAGDTVVVFTARSEDFKEVTERWLEAHGYKYHDMFMRPLNDHRPDYIVKKEMLDRVREKHGEIYAAFEDRDSVIKMYAENGVFSFNVAQGKIQ